MAAIKSKNESLIDHFNEELDDFIRPRLLDEPQTYETVTVRVRGCEYGDSENRSVSVSGGKVIVESYDPATGRNLANIELTIPQTDPEEYAKVTFKIRHGLHYSVHSEVDGLGASFRPVFIASLDTREVDLWNLSLGIWGFGFEAVNDGDDNYRVYPMIFDADNENQSDLETTWDIKGSENIEDGYPMGVAVSTAKSSFLLHQNNKASESLAWSRSNYGKNVPALEEYYETAGRDFSSAQELAKKDFAGNLNSDKILTYLVDKPAAQFCAQSPDYMLQTYLPSAGELSLCYQNKEEINSAISYGEFDVAELDNNWYWSSSAYDRTLAWDVGVSNGYVYNYDKYLQRTVLAVSAFLYLY